jgi:HNH endonuclease/HB1, ASXL, restriction endonuclease HTH domain
MRIHEAAYKALRELRKPTHVGELYGYIEQNGYYRFGAKDPGNALAIQLSRRSEGLTIGKQSLTKLFYRASPATYGLLEWLRAPELEYDRRSTNEQRIDVDIKDILRGHHRNTEKQQLILARIGQGSYRANVLALWHHKCAVTGSRLALNASHIKPWRDSSNEERLDPNNGLPLVATLDRLFDSHLISFTKNGNVVLSTKISQREQRALRIDAAMKLRRVPSVAIECYLREHRTLLI